MTVEPTDGLPRTDRHGVTWTPRDGAWWGHIGHIGEDGAPYEDFRSWWELQQRGPLEAPKCTCPGISDSPDCPRHGRGARS